MVFETLVENGCKKTTNKTVLKFLLVISKWCRDFLTFIQTSRSCNWFLHLKSAEEMMLDFSSMNRMKYHRMWPVYIADIYDLQNRAPDVWAVFMREDFSCQKSDILGMAIGQNNADDSRIK